MLIPAGLISAWLINRGVSLLVGIHHFCREHPPNNGTGLLILGSTSHLDQLATDLSTRFLGLDRSMAVSIYCWLLRFHFHFWRCFSWNNGYVFSCLHFWGLSQGQRITSCGLHFWLKVGCRLLGCWLFCWAVAFAGHWAVELLSCWADGLLGCWADGLCGFPAIRFLSFSA